MLSLSTLRNRLSETSPIWYFSLKWFICARVKRIMISTLFDISHILKTFLYLMRSNKWSYFSRSFKFILYKIIDRVSRYIVGHSFVVTKTVTILFRNWSELTNYVSYFTTGERIHQSKLFHLFKKLLNRLASIFR